MRGYLIRHGEVMNPNHVVYADLPGFGLSASGLRQAAAAADKLRHDPPVLVVTSPLERALETAQVIAAAAGSPVEPDERLTEWRLSARWAGVPWLELSRMFPGELEAYLTHPTDLPFSPESLAEMAERVAASIEQHTKRMDGPVAFVSHQDPLHAAQRLLTDQGFDDYHADKPAHCSIATVQRNGSTWSQIGYWTPEQ
jgi:broad specificity phosphatase PhoE